MMVSFATVAVFGIAIMNHAMAAHGDCVAARAQGVVCPELLGTAGFLALHSRFFQSVTSMTLLSVVTLLLAGAALFLAREAPVLMPIRLRSSRVQTTLPDRHEAELISCLSRCEMSPNSA